MAQFGASPREEVGFGLPTILVKKSHKRVKLGLLKERELEGPKDGKPT